MPAERDIAAFEQRAARYEQGWLGRLHHEIADRVAAVALSTEPAPSRILDVGCGTGYLLRTLADRCPDALQFAGIDAASAMVDVARASTRDERIAIELGAAEQLPYADAAFDLVLSVTSFDHWPDQAAGIAECARVLAPGGYLVLADLFSPWLTPTLLAGRRGKARTKRRANRLLAAAGLRAISWQSVYPLIKVVTTTK